MKSLVFDVMSALLVSGAILSFFVVERLVALGPVAKRPALLSQVAR